MAHCHIAEQHESGTMFSFNVDEAAQQPAPRPGERGTSSE
jgi:hypothetical protein